MQDSIAEVLPLVMQGIEEKTAKAETLSNVVSMRNTVVRDAAWIEGQKENIRKGTQENQTS